MLLEELYQKTQNIEEEFKKKKILFIPSESYDGATITIIEGLYKLGFKILTYKKNNINSWFCNEIIDNLDNIEDEIDFVLSNLHWGTRWSLYKKLKHEVPYILIDGDDRIHGNERSNWLDKYNNYIRSYKVNPPEEIKNMELSPYRWMEKMEDYKPDIVFMSNKYHSNKNEIYLPFGINDVYLDKFENITFGDRNIDVCHIPGPGSLREEMQRMLPKITPKNFTLHNEKVYGSFKVDEKINIFCQKDNNVHSWHRWRNCDEYFKTLNRSKIFVFTVCDKENAPGWDNKRFYEVISSGCLILFYKPRLLNTSEYPQEELCDFSSFEFKNYKKLQEKINFLLSNPSVLEEKIKEFHENGIKYYNSKQIAKYFLFKIKTNYS